MQKPTLLISSPDQILRHDFKQCLIDHGFKLIETRSIADNLSAFEKTLPDLVIIYSAHKDPQDDIQIAKDLRQKKRHIPILFITKYSSEETAIAALKANVDDYFKVPFPIDAVLLSVKKFLPDYFAEPSKDIIPNNPSLHLDDQLLIGASRQMRAVKSYLQKVAQADSTVLITGETGTGKELAAELIHFNSARGHKPFICVNCAALPESLIESELFGYDRGAFTGAFITRPGKFELARGGTVFLDEIGDMSSYAQAKILRSIENKKIYHLGGKGDICLDARIIAATNQEPEQLLAEGRFREGLYYRLNVARVHLPPLRERKRDIPKLVSHGIQNLNRRFERDVKGLTKASMTCLYRYHWPGNVRELLNCLEATFISLPSREMDYIELPKHVQKDLKWEVTDSKAERNLILTALLETKWNKSSAAQKLNWSRMTLYRKIEKYHIVEKRSLER
jgi:DNA-binding NtrC family response regulator